MLWAGKLLSPTRQGAPQPKLQEAALQGEEVASEQAPEKYVAFPWAKTGQEDTGAGRRECAQV